MDIRTARPDELPLLQDIERAAGSCFRNIGMPEIADDDPLPLHELARYQRAGTAWVADDHTGTPVAYLLAEPEPVDGNLHIEQVSVHPRHAHRRIGRALIDHLAHHGAAPAVPALTLTTFAEVPWNAPYYARCGFRILADDALSPGLRAIRRREAAHGLERWPRVCMRRGIAY
ncbi:GNAT family N-acetyltransferase [Streptomyces sp. NBC_01537]|uniref:GNAT family N-acetyltransferase n=1 Tax=Streptomyces sp. NBC_01537 TaxID=2903896 RepID=UPI00386E9B1B